MEEVDEVENEDEEERLRRHSPSKRSVFFREVSSKEHVVQGVCKFFSLRFGGEAAVTGRSANGEDNFDPQLLTFFDVCLDIRTLQYEGIVWHGFLTMIGEVHLWQT